MSFGAALLKTFFMRTFFMRTKNSKSSVCYGYAVGIMGVMRIQCNDDVNIDISGYNIYKRASKRA